MIKKVTAAVLGICSMVGSLNPVAAQVLLPYKAFDLLSSGIKSDTIVISDELSKLFGSNGCNLGKKVQAKLDKIKDKEPRGLVPDDLQKSLGGKFEAKARKVEDSSAQAALHVVQASEGTNSTQLTLSNSATYNNLSATLLVNSQASNMAYTLDCTGYLTAALAAGAGFTGASAKTAADTAMRTERSLVVIQAAVSSPVALAINPASGTYLMSAVNRLDILNAMAVEAKIKYPEATDALKFTSWRSLALIWTSNQGSSSLQGSTTVNVNAGLGVFSANASGGASMSKSVSFQAFNTYILNEDLNGSISITYAELRKLISGLVAQNMPKTPATRVGIDFVTIYEGLPKNICILPWSVASVDNVEPKSPPGTVKTSWQNDGCHVTFTPTQASSSATMLSLVANSGFDAKQTLSLSYPILKD